MYSLALAPACLHDTLTHHWNCWHERASEEQQQVLADWLAADTGHDEHLIKAWGGSEFIAKSALDRPGVFCQLLTNGELDATFSLQDFAEKLSAMLSACETDKDLDRALREYRRRMMMRIVWRDFNRLADWNETTNDMSYLAEIVVQQTIDFHYQLLAETWGVPIGKVSGEEQKLLVLELNN